MILLVMYFVSAVIRFVQELKSKKTADYLQSLVETDVTVFRSNEWIEISVDELKADDKILLEAGMKTPRDVILTSAVDFYISESAITGESDVYEKTDGELCRRGSIVVGGKAEGVIQLANNPAKKIFPTERRRPSFDKGASSIAGALLRFAMVLIPLVFIISYATKGDVLRSFLFSLSVGVGLIPEMLPMVVNSCLAHGSSVMGKKQTVVKNINAMQSFASLDVLCVDKTGTLTGDKIILEYYMDVLGNESSKVLEYGYINSLYHSGVKNHLDSGILDVRLWKNFNAAEIEAKYKKIDSLPFDYQRKIASVLVAEAETQEQMIIVKGGVEEILCKCSAFEYKNEISIFNDECRRKALEMTGEMSSDGIKLVAVAYRKISGNAISSQDENELVLLGFLAFFDAPKQSAFSAIAKLIDGFNNDGFRVLALAHKTNPSPVGKFSVEDEKDMVLLGYLAFLDPPKESTAEAIRALKNHGVETKILTGDNEKVTRTICRQVGLKVSNMVLGSEIEKMSDEELSRVVEKTEVFAKLTPDQKARVVTCLRQNGHTVGFMGDGINDAQAMKVSDVGISVDSAVDIAKESAEIILLEKDLMVLEEGIVEGRKTYANMIKYIKMTASSNFGNMFSVLAASALLPFLPMMSVHLIFLNLIYDLSCTAIPWDNVDEEFLAIPRKWDAGSVGNFMIWIGPTSSIFDFTTYIFMYFVFCPLFVSNGILFNDLANHFAGAELEMMKFKYAAMFQAGWFIESMWSQTLVIHMIRTPKLPFIQSRASLPLTLLTFTGIAMLTIIPFTPFGAMLGFIALPASYFGYLIPCIMLYMALATSLKKAYVRHFGELL